MESLTLMPIDGSISREQCERMVLLQESRLGLIVGLAQTKDCDCAMPYQFQYVWPGEQLSGTVELGRGPYLGLRFSISEVRNKA